MFLKALPNFIKFASQAAKTATTKTGSLVSAQAVAQARRQAGHVQSLTHCLKNTRHVGTRGNIVIAEPPKFDPDGRTIFSSRVFFRQTENGGLEYLKTKTISPSSSDSSFLCHWGATNHNGTRHVRVANVYANGSYNSTVTSDFPGSIKKSTLVGDRTGLKKGIEKELWSDGTVKTKIIDCSVWFYFWYIK